MKKAAFYQMCQTDEALARIKEDMHEFGQSPESRLALIAALAADERCKQREAVRWGIRRARGVKA